VFKITALALLSGSHVFRRQRRDGMQVNQG
jgi:hypothetical protein